MAPGVDSMTHIEKILQNCSTDHFLNTLFQHKNEYFFTSSFLHHLNNALDRLLRIDYKAYNDFITHKLPARKNSSFEFHSYISSLCELSIIHSFLSMNCKIDSFDYEPCLRHDNKKNVEFSLKTNCATYNVEVKSPNLESHYTTINEKIDKHGTVVRFDSRGIKKPDRANEIPSPTMRVKDFLVDANLKFPQRSEEDSLNILFIAWDENTDQPCIALKEQNHGLLVANSDFRNADGSEYKFDNIDLIFISDLYKNFIAHMNSRNEPIPSLVSGVPYFENALQRVHPLAINPFLLQFSRNVVVNVNCNFQDQHVLDAIFQLPITFYDQDVLIVDEDYVEKNCAGVKFSYR